MLNLLQLGGSDRNGSRPFVGHFCVDTSPIGTHDATVSFQTAPYPSTVSRYFE